MLEGEVDGEVDGGARGRRVALGRGAAAARPGHGLEPVHGARFAGLGLSLRGDRELCALWLRAAGGEARDVSDVTLRCNLRAGAPARPGSSALGWEWSEPSGWVQAPEGEAHVRRDGDGFTADVNVAREPHAARLLLVGLAALLVHLRGGLILHAASVALDGAAVAFMGPSGAGKSTACRQVSGGVPFSVDRLALLPASSGASRWLAHPLPGGSQEEQRVRAAPGWLPLRGLLRVRACPTGSHLERTAAARAVLLARESTFQLGRGAAAEHAVLGTLERLVRDLGVGVAHVQLGADLTELLRARGARAETP